MGGKGACAWGDLEQAGQARAGSRQAGVGLVVNDLVLFLS